MEISHNTHPSVNGPRTGIGHASCARLAVLRDRYNDIDDPVVASVPASYREALAARIDALLAARQRQDDAA